MKKIVYFLIYFLSLYNFSIAKEINNSNFISDSTKIINHLRHTTKKCKSDDIPNKEPLSDLIWNEKLANTANLHAKNMVEFNFFSHEGIDGTNVGERALKFEYHWTNIGENIAAGEESLSQVFTDWINSYGHCTNIINPQFSDFGLIKIISPNPNDIYSTYWVLVLGASIKK